MELIDKHESDQEKTIHMLKQKLFTTISLLSIFVFCFLLAIIRWINIFNEDIYVISEGINSHITNFTLSLMVCTLIGYVLLITGKRFVSNLLVGVVLVVINFVYEILLPILNTTDIVDAFYGLFGVAISLMYLCIIYKLGFVRE